MRVTFFLRLVMVEADDVRFFFLSMVLVGLEEEEEPFFFLNSGSVAKKEDSRLMSLARRGIDVRWVVLACDEEVEGVAGAGCDIL